MRTLLGLILIIGIFVFIANAFGLIDISRTREGKLPELKAEGGQLPGFDVRTAKVEMGTRNTTVAVPTVGTRNETVAVPTLEVKKPEPR